MSWSDRLDRALRRPVARRRAALSVAAACLALAACGFQLRGSANFPFESIHIPGTSPLTVELTRNINSGSNARVRSEPKDAQAILVILAEARDKTILSLSTAGRAREYQILYRVSFRVHDGKGGEFVSANDIIVRRDITFNDQVLAKESEEVVLFREMQSDVVQQMIRRMQAGKYRRGDDD